jgi:mono/diheme cytochrome c family protein
LIQRGEELALIGNCNVCHTAAGGEVLAGGRAVPTPFGTVYSTNITPDPETGIGAWSEDAFIRAMRQGIDREGNHLYPAFPYDHFTLVTDDDNRALYAFLMTREPVSAEAPPNELVFPLNFRPLLAGWKMLFLDEGPYRPNPELTAEMNRGAYLVEGLAHCGACHTPRNALGAEEEERAYAGGYVEGWFAYPINGSSPAPVPWNAESLYELLRNGFHQHHGVTRGPMAPVSANLATVPEEDVRAMALYAETLLGEPSAERVATAEELIASVPAGTGLIPASADSQAIPALPGEPSDTASMSAAIYEGACAGCHESGRPLPYGGLYLALSTGINANDPRNVINVIMNGLPPAQAEQSSIMPPFAGAFTDEQVVELVQYLRDRFSDKPPWENVAALVRESRESTTEVAGGARSVSAGVPQGGSEAQ